MSENNLDEFFTELWMCYPRDLCHKKPGSKSEARKKVEKINPDKALQQKILHGMREWMHISRKEAKIGKTDRWPFLTTWLNQERWELDDIPQSGNLQELDNRLNPKCDCGGPVNIQNKCWRCYDKTSVFMAARRKELYHNLTEKGLIKRADETREEYSLRCLEWGSENTSMAGFKAIRKAMVQRLTRGVQHKTDGS